MRSLSTLLLILAIVLAGLWIWQGPSIGRRLGLTRTSVPAAPSPSAAVLADQLTKDKIRKFDLTPPGGETISLERKNDTWTQPGNWPVRQDEANKLVEVLVSLRTRFTPIPLEGESPDLSPYGLAKGQRPAVVKVDLGGETRTLSFGRPTAKSSDSLVGQPTYLRIDSQPEVLRLSEEVYTALSRSPDEYRRRQLVPDAERVKLTGGEPPPNPTRPTPPAAARVPILSNDVVQIHVEGKEGAFTLKRVAKNPDPKPDPDRPGDPSLTANKLATAWEIVEPVRDKADPAKLRAVLTAVPDVWAETFLADKTAAETGLDKPEQSVVITRANGQKVALRVGRESRRQTKIENATPPSPFNPRPPQPTITEEVYSFAKLDDNPLVFEVRTDRLTDLFAKPDDLRDPSLGRFETNEVQELSIAVKGQPAIKLVKKKGNPEATVPADRDDRWYLGEGPSAILAEPAKVTELLDSLSRLEAKNSTPSAPFPGMPPPPGGEKNLIDNPDPKKLADLGIDTAAGTKVTVVTRAKAPEGEPEPPAQTITYLIGKQELDKKKLHVQVLGWPRVNVVADDVMKLIDRPALAYRGRRLFDTAEAKLDAVTVSKAGAPAFALKLDSAVTPGVWKLTVPSASATDEPKASQLTGDLARLEAAEYVNDAPKPEDLTKYGLDKPRYSVNITFTGKEGKTTRLDVGAAREGKSESYARLDGTGSVFVIPNTLVDSLEKGSLGLLPLQLWTVASDKFITIAVTRGEDETKETYNLTQSGADWKLSGPFDATASFGAIQGVLTGLGNLRAEKYEAQSAADAAKFGLDKPALKLTVTYKEPKPGTDPPKEETVTKSITVGKVADETSKARYATLGEGGAVFVVPDPFVKAADKPALDLLDKTLLSLELTRVNKVQISPAKAEDAVTLVKDDKGVWKAEGAAFAPDKPTVDALVLAATRPAIARLAAYGSAVKWADFGLEKPDLTLTVTVAPPASDANAKPETHTIKLGRTDTTGERFARIDDRPAVAALAPASAESLAKGKLDFADRTLLTFDPATLNGITRKKGTDELELLPAVSGAGWEIVKPAKQKADGPTMDELADQLSKLRATKVAAYGAKDLKPFGLDAPPATVTLKVGLDKPEDKILKLGSPVDAAKPDGDRYATVETKGDVTVGVLAAALANKLLAEPIKFRDKGLARFVDADRATIVRGDRTVSFAKINGTWKTTAPVDADAEQGELDELINSLARLRADELVADNPTDLKPFGLDPPAGTWKLYAGDKEVLALQFGKNDGSKAYAKLAQDNIVAKLEPALTNRVLAEYRKRAVWTGVDAAQAESVTVKNGGNSFTLTKAGQNWIDSANPKDVIDAAKVSELLATLAGLKAERYAADKDADLKLFGLAPPQRTITVTQSGGVSKTLLVGGFEGSSAEKRVYAKPDEKDRTDVVVLSDSDTEKLLRDRSAYRK